MTKMPRKLYKYLTTDRIDVLRNGTIRFTQPNALNDPFERAAKLDRIFERSLPVKREAAPVTTPSVFLL